MSRHEAGAGAEAEPGWIPVLIPEDEIAQILIVLETGIKSWGDLIDSARAAGEEDFAADWAERQHLLMTAYVRLAAATF